MFLLIGAKVVRQSKVGPLKEKLPKVLKNPSHLQEKDIMAMIRTLMMTTAMENQKTKPVHLLRRELVLQLHLYRKEEHKYLVRLGVD